MPVFISNAVLIRLGLKCHAFSHCGYQLTLFFPRVLRVPRIWVQQWALFSLIQVASPVLWSAAFHAWERLACISAGWAHNCLLELSKCTDTTMTFIGVKFVLWTVLYNLSKEIKIVMLK